ncbi:MAG: hypothetical protein WDA71_03210 [Actinomycetota bacterium]
MTPDTRTRKAKPPKAKTPRAALRRLFSERDGIKVFCPECRMGFHPRLTGGDCPVCSWRPEQATVPGAVGAASRALSDPDIRPVLIVVVATLANLGLWLGLYFGFANR